MVIIPKHFTDIAGKTFNKLTVIEKIHRDKKHLVWRCKCECGNESFVTSTDLIIGHTKSCGKCQDEIDLAPFKCVYASYIRGAKRRGLSFNLTLEQFVEITSQDCHYCGDKPNQKYTKKGMRGVAIYNGIDRVDNTIGYEIDNVVTCCGYCNFSKGKKTVEEFEEWIDRLCKFRSKKQLSIKEVI